MPFLLEVTWNGFWAVIKDFFVPLAGATAGAWATFAVFKGQLEESRRSHVEALKSSFQEEAVRQDSLAEKKLTHFVWLLDEVIQFATKQNADYLLTAEGIISNPIMLHPFSVRASSVLSRVLTLKQDDIFFSFIRKALDTSENRKHVAIIYNKLDFIDESLKENRLKYKSHLKTYWLLVTEYREVIEGIRDLIDETIQESRITGAYEKDTLAHHLSNVQIIYIKALEHFPEASRLDWHQEHYLTPLQTELLKHFRADPRAYKIISTGRRANILIGRMKYSSFDAVSVLKEGNNFLTIAINELQTEADYVRSVLLTT